VLLLFDLCFIGFWFLRGMWETAALLKRPRTPPGSAPTVDYQTADSEHLMKRTRAGVQPDEVKTVSTTIALTV
jgi:hypothetical protein